MLRLKWNTEISDQWKMVYIVHHSLHFCLMNILKCITEQPVNQYTDIFLLLYKLLKPTKKKYWVNLLVYRTSDVSGGWG
jgi:hypothetical protein